MTQRITGTNGAELSVYECGQPDGQAILLIHGFAQSCLSWSCQFNSALTDEFRLIAMDLSGHGMSDKPRDVANYATGKYWADDVAAVIDQMDLNKPVLASWSHGGLVISDYLQCYGDENIGAINFVAAAATLGTEEARNLIGPGSMDLIKGLLSEDLAENITATRQFVINCFAEPPCDEVRETALAFNMMVSPQVRRDMFLREVHFGDVLKSVTVPTLVTQGTADTIALPPMAEIFLNAILHAIESSYQDVSHAPFMEDAGRFNHELSELGRGVATS